MKRIVTIAIVTFAMLSLCRADEQNQVGRFQLINASVESPNIIEKTMVTTRKLFRIDTVTGKVWEYAEVAGIGEKIKTPITGWTAISETDMGQQLNEQMIEDSKLMREMKQHQ